MRACFLGQNVCALGYGVAMVQTLPETPDPGRPDSEEKKGPPPAPTPNRMFAELRRQLPNVNGRPMVPVRS
jgi:hypothetical protein